MPQSQPITGITYREFSHLLGLSAPRINHFVKTGMEGIEPDGSVNFETAIEWYSKSILAKDSEKRVARAKRRWKRGEVKPGSVSARNWSDGRNTRQTMTFSEARAKREIYSAKLKQLEAMEALGKLVRFDDVQTAAFDTYRAVRNQLLTIPDRVAAEFAVEDDPKKIATRLKGEIKLALRKVVLGREKAEKREKVAA